MTIEQLDQKIASLTALVHELASNAADGAARLGHTDLRALHQHLAKRCTELQADNAPPAKGA